MQIIFSYPVLWYQQYKIEHFHIFFVLFILFKISIFFLFLFVFFNEKKSFWQHHQIMLCWKKNASVEEPTWSIKFSVVLLRSDWKKSWAPHWKCCSFNSSEKILYKLNFERTAFCVVYVVYLYFKPKKSYSKFFSFNICWFLVCIPCESIYSRYKNIFCSSSFWLDKIWDKLVESCFGLVLHFKDPWLQYNSYDMQFYRCKFF